MPRYKFLAKDKKGNITEDILDAPSRYEAITALKQRDLIVISVSVVNLGEDIKQGAPKLEKKKKYPFFSNVSITELAVFTHQLSVSVNSGVPLIESLQSIAEDMDDNYFKRVLLKVNDDIRAGKHFSEAISKHKKVFNAIFVSLIQSAEESGSLPYVLEYLSKYLERYERLTRKIVSTTAYPVFITFFFIIVVFIITIFILPRFERIFSSLSTNLPQLTKIIFGINRFFIHNILIFCIGMVALVIGLALYGRSSTGRYKIDEFKLKLPFFGGLIKKYSLARFCRLLAVMLRGGVPIIRAIKISSATSGNKVLEKSLERAREKILAGSGIANSLAKDKNFPKLVMRMIEIGESTGRLPDVLDKIAEMYEDQIEGSITVATSLFEPVVIVIFGGVILLLVLAVYLPVFNMAMAIQR